MNQTQKILFVSLLLAGAIVWIYNTVLFLGAFGKGDTTVSDQSLPLRTTDAAFLAEDTLRRPFVGAFRDPFEPSWGVSNQKPPPQNPPRPIASQALPPRLSVLGILWHPKKPMATIQGPDGQIENLHVGKTIAGATITRIERTAVIVQYGNRTIRLETGNPGM